MNKELNDIWNSECSYITPEINNADMYKGILMVHGCAMRFSLNKQIIENSNFLYRGTISGLYPDHSGVISIPTHTESEKTPKNDFVSFQLYSNANTIDLLKAYIEKRAFELYIKYADAIGKTLSYSSRKETITPVLAFKNNGTAFVEQQYPSVREETRKKYYGIIEYYYARMNDCPMSEYSKKQMSYFLDKYNVSNNNRQKLEDFWKFCIDKGITLNNNPFPPKEKKVSSAAALIEKAKKPDVLSDEVQSRLFETCLASPGIVESAVALDLWANVHLNESVKMYWRDIIFDDNDPDFAYLLIIKTDFAGATHMYNRPMFVQATRVLRKRYNELLQTFSASKLKDMLVLGKSDDMYHTIPIDILTKRINALLLSQGVLSKTFSELKSPRMAVSKRLFGNTYHANLLTKCGLKDDEFTVKFLRGESISNDTSSNNYISFTDDDAIHRLYSGIKVAKPIEDYDFDKETKEVIDGNSVYHFLPKRSDCVTGVSAKIILPPGASIKISDCFHGLTGDISVRGIDSSGKRMRKRKSNSAK